MVLVKGPGRVEAALTLQFVLTRELEWLPFSCPLGTASTGKPRQTAACSETQRTSDFS